MRTIVLNQTNIVPNTNNSTLVYKFPSSVSFNNSKIAIASINLYYSWVNISPTLQNNSLSFNWVNASNTNNYTTYTIYIPSGLYEVTDINAYLQFVFINAANLNTSQISPIPTAPFYLKDSIGDNVYFLEFVVNPTKYAIQLNTYNVPSTLPTNFSNPGGTLLPAATFNPIVAIGVHLQSRFQAIDLLLSIFIHLSRDNQRLTLDARFVFCFAKLSHILIATWRRRIKLVTKIDRVRILFTYSVIVHVAIPRSESLGRRHGTSCSRIAPYNRSGNPLYKCTRFRRQSIQLRSQSSGYSSVD
jgi:hypothetical protein